MLVVGWCWLRLPLPYRFGFNCSSSWEMTFLRTPNWVVMKQSKAHTAGQEDKALVTHDGSRQSQSDGAWDMCTSRDQEASQRALVEVEDRYEAALDATGWSKARLMIFVQREDVGGDCYKACSCDNMSSSSRSRWVFAFLMRAERRCGVDSGVDFSAAFAAAFTVSASATASAVPAPAPDSPSGSPSACSGSAEPAAAAFCRWMRAIVAIGFLSLILRRFFLFFLSPEVAVAVAAVLVVPSGMVVCSISMGSMASSKSSLVPSA